eukprot:gene132-41238_t
MERQLRRPDGQSGAAQRDFQLVFQCRQMPGTFREQSETVGFRSKWSQHTVCPHVSIKRVEWVTDRRGTVIPYGLLIRVYPRDRPPTDGFRSPVDPAL